MKEDYKEELNAVQIEKLNQIVSRTDKSGNEKVLLLIDFIYSLSETRYHPDTLEPVDKPDPKNYSGVLSDVRLNYDYDKWKSDNLTLDQVFERYKEMIEGVNEFVFHYTGCTQNITDKGLTFLSDLIKK
jgi:hypothetical protein